MEIRIVLRRTAGTEVKSVSMDFNYLKSIAQGLILPSALPLEDALCLEENGYIRNDGASWLLLDRIFWQTGVVRC